MGQVSISQMHESPGGTILRFLGCTRGPRKLYFYFGMCHVRGWPGHTFSSVFSTRGKGLGLLFKLLF